MFRSIREDTSFEKIVGFQDKNILNWNINHKIWIGLGFLSCFSSGSGKLAFLEGRKKMDLSTFFRKLKINEEKDETNLM